MLVSFSAIEVEPSTPTNEAAYFSNIALKLFQCGSATLQMFANKSRTALQADTTLSLIPYSSNTAFKARNRSRYRVRELFILSHEIHDRR
jgi:hypothetical protein